MWGWISMTSDMMLFISSNAKSGIDADENLVQIGPRRDQLLLQRVGDERLDAGAIGRNSVGQGIVHQAQEFLVALVFGLVAFARAEICKIRLLRRDEGVHQRARQMWMGLQHFILDDDQAMDRINAGAAKPVR